MALAGAGVDMVFTLRQDGNAITGSLDSAASGGFGGGPTGGPIQDGKMDGSNLSFRVGTTTYAGKVDGDRIELTRSAPTRRTAAGAPPAPLAAASRPAVGPPPHGTDPSFGAGFGPGRGAPPAPLVLKRAKR